MCSGKTLLHVHLTWFRRSGARWVLPAVAGCFEPCCLLLLRARGPATRLEVCLFGGIPGRLKRDGVVKI